MIKIYNQPKTCLWYDNDKYFIIILRRSINKSVEIFDVSSKSVLMHGLRNN